MIKFALLEFQKFKYYDTKKIQVQSWVWAFSKRDDPGHTEPEMIPAKLTKEQFHLLSVMEAEKSKIKHSFPSWQELGTGSVIDECCSTTDTFTGQTECETPNQPTKRRRRNTLF